MYWQGRFFGCSPNLSLCRRCISTPYFGVMLTNQQGNKSRGRNDITTESSNRVLGIFVMLGLVPPCYILLVEQDF
jgi:hypothetical protein